MSFPSHFRVRDPHFARPSFLFRHDCPMHKYMYMRMYTWMSKRSTSCPDSLQSCTCTYMVNTKHTSAVHVHVRHSVSHHSSTCTCKCANAAYMYMYALTDQSQTSCQSPWSRLLVQYLSFIVHKNDMSFNGVLMDNKWRVMYMWPFFSSDEQSTC